MLTALLFASPFLALCALGLAVETPAIVAAIRENRQ